MKHFKTIIQVDLDNSYVKKVKKFAKECAKTTNYSDTNQTSIHKIENDHFIGKMGEEAVKKTFQYFIDSKRINGPDYKIYSKLEKSWKEDLFIDGVGLSVKTQKKSTSNTYELSWCFQKNSDKNRRDTTLNNPDLWVCFVLYDDTTSGNYFYVYPPIQLKNLEFKEPKLGYLKGKKDVIYAKDLTHIKENYLVE